MPDTSDHRRAKQAEYQRAYRARHADNEEHRARVAAQKRESARRCRRAGRKRVPEPAEQVRARNQRHQDVINALKDAPCTDCGHEFHPAAMDFDHVHGEKRYGISANTVTRPDFMEELSKCELRCANCHRTRHALEGTLGRPAAC